VVRYDDVLPERTATIDVTKTWVLRAGFLVAAVSGLMLYYGRRQSRIRAVGTSRSLTL
jgi:hypothetical protein